MQLDMHYYGTFAIARAAGITPAAAEVIATCAQFVDDNVAGTTLRFDNGARVDSVATAHHAVDTENLDPHDQRLVWIPFHFLPGDLGDTFTERLKCRKDSLLAREMVAHHLSLADKPFGLELMGIAAHVYADTFSHYGFAGVSSRGNRVVNDSFEFSELKPDIEKYIRDKHERFKSSTDARGLPNFRDDVRGKSWWERTKNTVTSWFGEALSGALGHGSVATFPDRPYLVWAFDYERDDEDLKRINPNRPRHSSRDNSSTFLEGCEALHGMFDLLRQSRSDIDNGDHRQFSQIRDAVSDTLRVQAPKQGRIDAWQDVARSGSVFGAGNETIPLYEGESWNDHWRNCDGQSDASELVNTPVWHFYQAAAIHRTFVLRDLLPAHGLVVS